MLSLCTRRWPLLDTDPPTACKGMPKTGDAAFDAWIQKMAKASPADAKDTDDFKYMTFTEMPPFTDKHKSLMRKTLTEELWAKYAHLYRARAQCARFTSLARPFLRPFFLCVPACIPVL